MATHSSILVWKIPWTEESGGLQSWGHKDLGIIVQIGSFMEQALLCSKHYTKGFTGCFPSVVDRSTVPTSPGSSVERQTLLPHSGPAASECLLEGALHLLVFSRVWEAWLSHFISKSSPQSCKFRDITVWGHKASKRRCSSLAFGPVSIPSYTHHLLKPDPFLTVQLRLQHFNQIFLDASCCK